MSNNKRVLVTGGSGGIGKAVALNLAAKGFEVVLHYRSGLKSAQEVSEQIKRSGGNVSLVQFDVSDRLQTRDAIVENIERDGAYYGVVCNAGVTRDNGFPAMSGDDWDAVLHTNLDSFYNVLHPSIMPMIRLRSGGRIVTISSVSGVIGNRGQTNYSASKAGLIGATKALAVELGKRQITVNCVAPGVIETEMISENVASEAKKMIPLGHFGSPDDVASTVAFLMSDAARYITRQVIGVNGGMC